MENPSMQLQRHGGFASVGYVRGSFVADRHCARHCACVGNKGVSRSGGNHLTLSGLGYPIL